MTRYVYHPSSVEISVRQHVPDCQCRGGELARAVDLRCVHAYLVEADYEPPAVEATRPGAVAAAVEHARAAEAALIENHHGEARAENDMARTWALIARELPEVAEAPLDDTAVIPRVEPGQGGMPLCYCTGVGHPAGAEGCSA